MKKIKLLMAAILMSFLLTGCAKEDYEKYASIVGDDGITCEYQVDSYDAYGNYLAAINKIKFVADKTKINIIYEVNNLIYENNYLQFNFNKKGEISDMDEAKTHKLADDTFEINLKTFKYENFLNYYNYHNSCQEYIYLQPDYRNYDKKGNLYDTNYDTGAAAWDYITYKLVFEDIPDNPNQDIVYDSNCNYSKAISCEKYVVDTKLDNEVTIELGRTPSNNNESELKYYMVKSNNKSGIDFAYNQGVDSSGVNVGHYSYIVRAVDWQNLFPSDGYVSKDDFYIDEKDLYGSYVIHITTKDSQTIKDYEDNADIEEPPKRVEPHTGSIIIDKVPIKDVVLCDEGRVLQAFQIIGYLLFVAKIVVPLLIIIMAMIDFTKALMATDEKANKEAAKGLVRRLIIGVIIFLIPTIVDLLLTYVDGALATTSKFSACTHCLFNPFDNDNCRKEETRDYSNQTINDRSQDGGGGTIPDNSGGGTTVNDDGFSHSGSGGKF